MKLKRGVKLGVLYSCLILIGATLLTVITGPACAVGIPFLMSGIFGMVKAAAFNRFETVNKFLEWIDKDD